MYLHHEEEDGVVKGKMIVTLCTLIISPSKRGGRGGEIPRNYLYHS